MRYRPGHKAKTRAAILDAAGRAFREKGFAGIGVDGLAAAAGLTSGAFYGHFRSKAAAFRQAAGQGVRRFADGVRALQAKRPEGWLPALTRFYLGPQHRAEIAGGCALPSLSAEVARADRATRAAYEAELVAAMRAMAAAPPLAGRPDAERRAWAAMALLAGGVMLARAVESEATAGAIAEAAERAVVELAARP